MKKKPMNHTPTTIKSWASIPIPEFSKYVVSTHGEVKTKSGDKLLSQNKIYTGYNTVRLYDGNGGNIHAMVHRLVAITYIPIPAKFKKLGLGYEDLIVNHKDGDKTNNKLHNLEWETVKGNAIHVRDHGLLGYVGENSHLAKMDNKTAEKCCKLLAKGMATGDVAKKLNISKKAVIHVKAGECWVNISRKYTFPKNDQPKPNSIDPSVIHSVCKLLDEEKYTDTEIAKKCGISRKYVSDIRLGKRQVKISKNYNFLAKVKNSA